MNPAQFQVAAAATICRLIAGAGGAMLTRSMDGSVRVGKRTVFGLWPAMLLTIAPAQAQATARDGAHDFDWEIGAWSTSLRYLTNPLSADADRWVDYAGTSIVRAAMDGEANLVELDVAGPAGRIRGVSLRLYDPRGRQWRLNFASMRDGRLTAPTHGGFDANGRGLFFGEDEVGARAVLVRFTITPEGRDTVRFVQSFSADAGASWEDNWIAVDRRRG